MEIRTDFLTIGPDEAREYLRDIERTQLTRPLDVELVARYAASMSEGRWQLSSDAIAFDTSGQLLNGFHRLSAVIDSGVASEFLVVRGLDPRALSSIDDPATVPSMLERAFWWCFSRVRRWLRKLRKPARRP